MTMIVPIASEMIVAMAAPQMPFPSGKMKSQSRKMFEMAETMFTDIAILGAPSSRMMNEPTIRKTPRTGKRKMPRR